MSWYYVSVVMKATSLALGRMATHSVRPTSLKQKSTIKAQKIVLAYVAQCAIMYTKGHTMSEW